MKKASDLFTDADRQAVAAAVADAEQQTSSEIVPVVATASGRYDRAEDLFGVLFAIAALAASWVLFQGVRPQSAEWTGGPELVLGLLPVIAIVFGGFLLGAVVATKLPVLRLPFIAQKEIAEEVERAASDAFRKFRVSRTAEGVGVLIYVSLFEHRVRILGDSDIDDRLSAAQWNEIRDLVVDGLRAGKGADGLCAAIRRLGEMLSSHFPPKSDDVNELHNELRFID